MEGCPRYGHQTRGQRNMISQSNLLYFKNLQFIYLIGSLCGQNIILSTSSFFLSTKHLPIFAN